VYWINHYNSNKPESGFNLDGGGNKNKSHHELTRRKISEIARKQGRWQRANHPIYGKKHTEEEKKERRKHLVKYRRNTENKRRIIEMKKQNNNIHVAIEAKKKAVVQLSLDGKYIAEYESVIEASNSTGASSAHISDCCKWKRKTSRGFIWVYKED